MTTFGKWRSLSSPKKYKQFRLIRTHGRVYGVPLYLNSDKLILKKRIDSHPEVLSAASWQELQDLIDAHHSRQKAPEILGGYEGYRLVRHEGAVYGIPAVAGAVDLGREYDRYRAGILTGRTCEEIKVRIDERNAATPVEFAGWLPIFELSGNCGQHPQFAHAADAPPGYWFTRSIPPEQRPTRMQQARVWLYKRMVRLVSKARAMTRPFFAAFRAGPKVSLPDRLRILTTIGKLFLTLLYSGGRISAVLRFLQSRHYNSQLLLAHHRGPVFLTSMPYTYGQNPWIVEIEDPTTLFYPLIENGNTADMKITASPYFPIVKTLLESDSCKGIVTHIKSTAEMIPTMFGSQPIAKKVHHVPLGVKLPQRWQRHSRNDSEPIDIVFINSWCQVPANFFVRGGLDVLEAFGILHQRYPQLRLTLRSELPPLDRHYHRIMEKSWVRVIDRFMSNEEMDDLLSRSHIFLLPSARVHIVSLLQAMSYGLAVVTSDGWGIQEYVTHERNGLIVPGRYGKTSWVDEQAGMLREDYEPMFTPDPEVIEGLVQAVSRLVEDFELRRRLGRTARLDVQTTYNLDQWNQGLRAVLDKTFGRERSQSIKKIDLRHPQIMSA